jgi:hypothetical protein
MRKLKLFLAATVLALGTLPFIASPASAVVCHDNPGGCCEDVTVLGKTILHIDC